MKIMHMADIHLDARMETNLDKDKAKLRKQELLATFSRAIDYAADHEVDAILIAGDLFDTASPSATSKHLVHDLIINHSTINFYILKGNHDGKDFLCDIEEATNLHLFSGEWTGYPLNAQQTIMLYGRELGSGSENTAALGLIPDPGKRNIVMLHGQEVSASNAKKGELIPIKDFRNKGIDYMALGHIHAPKVEKLDERGVYSYCGCLEGRGFDETGEHGFMLITISEEDLSVQYEFVPFAGRILHEIRVDVTGDDRTLSMKESIDHEIERTNPSPRDLIKIVLTGSVNAEEDHDLDYLKGCYEDQFFLVKVKDETIYRVSPEEYLKDASLKGEFVRLVLNDDTLSDAEKGRILHYGFQALNGEEVGK